MHDGTKTLGFILIFLAIAVAYLIGQMESTTYTYSQSIIIGSAGITFLILSKVIGVLEEIRDRLPEPDKPKEKKKPGRKVNRRSTLMQ